MEWVQIGLQFMADHSQLIATIATILLAGVQVALTTKDLQKGLLALMLRADKASTSGQLGDVNGERIMDLVVQLAMDRVVPRLPLYVRPFVTEQFVRRTAYDAYAEAKLYLQSGHLVPLPDSAAMAAPAPPSAPFPVPPHRQAAAVEQPPSLP